jgi:hypothetical protein
MCLQSSDFIHLKLSLLYLHFQKTISLYIKFYRVSFLGRVVMGFEIYHLSYTPSPFFALVICQIWTPASCLVLASDHTPHTHVAGITGMNHHMWLFSFFKHSTLTISLNFFYLLFIIYLFFILYDKSTGILIFFLIGNMLLSHLVTFKSLSLIFSCLNMTFLSVPLCLAELLNLCVVIFHIC